MKLRTYFVEDNPTIRENLIATLAELADVEAVGTAETEADATQWLGGFKPEVQHLQPSKVRRCHHLVRPRPINNFSLKSASPLPV